MKCSPVKNSSPSTTTGTGHHYVSYFKSDVIIFEAWMFSDDRSVCSVVQMLERKLILPLCTRIIWSYFFQSKFYICAFMSSLRKNKSSVLLSACVHVSSNELQIYLDVKCVKLTVSQWLEVIKSSWVTISFCAEQKCIVL